MAFTDAIGSIMHDDRADYFHIQNRHLCLWDVLLSQYTFAALPLKRGELFCPEQNGRLQAYSTVASKPPRLQPSRELSGTCA